MKIKYDHERRSISLETNSIIRPQDANTIMKALRFLFNHGYCVRLEQIKEK